MKTNFKKPLCSMLLGVACVATMVGTAFAGSTFTGYSVAIGALNGSAYSSTQTKETSGANGAVNSTTVSGDYVVDVRMEKLDSTAAGDWYRDLGDGTNTGYVIDGHKDQKYGSTVRLKFSNDITTLVEVQANGTWASQ